ncbi:MULTISPECIES: NupC/NupG family nucleoside CNT transporter [unclassified Motilimonas]|uniref:NupC/NupG family nucleoside CNT transporter n=1 Tax=Motilimonas TaxID=1914248 RepID=UPI001E3EBFE8|nr:MULTISPECIES: NupC/NupG family nucleoside CNT transporter [unclassified Motilimonas]MCE0558433.1 NupC/NupG family nucleoside CNT transporter [Motilimonas sp. E26]MDO6526595.1 NupC/NupG family nucleoside CNT transporter [Motilimonas sp. 1_MG-2023]
MAALMSLIGIGALLLIAYLLSDNKKAINFRTILGAFAIQAGLGAFVLYVPFGKDVLESISGGVQAVIDSAQAGINFLFGGLVSNKMFEVFGGGGFVFAFRVLPIIIFFSSLIAVLYYLGVMQWIIKLIGGGLHKVLRISRPEAMSATANIFVGQTEAPLVVRPFIPKMTQSELFAIMVGGLASVAGSVLAGYAGLGVELKYLIAASFMAAPGGLLMAKMMKPETQQVIDNMDDAMAEQEDKPANVIDAAASGASSGLQLALNVGAMLLAFIGLIALMNSFVGYVGGVFGHDNFTIQLILGYVFAPVAWLIGVPWAEAVTAGSFIGQKLVLNEFVAYIDFVGMRETLSMNTQVIVTFALCGFANLSSVAILLGGLGTMAPTRRHDIAKLGVKAIIAASLANLMSAALAGLFIAL